MCGSVAFLSPAADASTVLKRALELLEFRGPDTQSFALIENGGIGHCRLILRDATGGSQPRELRDGRKLAFVGELYNDGFLRSLLEVRGSYSSSRSDTEVLAKAIELWGDDVWYKLDGMFAVTLVSRDNRSLQLVRDSFGIKPLFYSVGDHGAAAASEPAALRSMFASHAASATGVTHYLLTSQVIHHNKTVWQAIDAVPPGHSVTLSDQSVVAVSWRNENSEKLTSVDQSEAATRLRYLLSEAVYRQRQADFPLGVFLSGGLDSSLIAALLAEHQTEPLQTFAIALQGDSEDLDFADRMAVHISANHVGVEATPQEFFSAMRDLTERRALPVSLPNEVLIHLLARVAARSVKAVLCGEGADELFGGYHRLHAKLRSVNNERAALIDAYRSATAWFSREDLQVALRLPVSVSAWQEADQVYLSAMLEHSIGADQVQSLLLYDHFPHLLLRLDGATMAASLEGRVPFTDPDVVQFARNLPSELLKPVYGLEKALLRKAGQGLLPEAILSRPKRAFNASLAILFASEEGQAELNRALGQPFIANLFHQEKLERILIEDSRSQVFHRTWLICSLGMWSDVCGVSEIC